MRGDKLNMQLNNKKAIVLAVVAMLLTGCGQGVTTSTPPTGNNSQTTSNPYEGVGWSSDMEDIAIRYRQDMGDAKGGREVDKFMEALVQTNNDSLSQPLTPEELDTVTNITDDITLFSETIIQLDGVTLNSESDTLQEVSEGERTNHEGNLSVVFLHGLVMDEVLELKPEQIEQALQELSGQTERVLVFVVRDGAGFIPLYVVNKKDTVYTAFN